MHICVCMNECMYACVLVCMYTCGCPALGIHHGPGSEAYKRGRIKRGCSQKPELQIGGKAGPGHIQNTGRVP